jgi:hypothetical protein
VNCVVCNKKVNVSKAHVVDKAGNVLHTRCYNAGDYDKTGVRKKGA